MPRHKIRSDTSSYPLWLAFSGLLSPYKVKERSDRVAPQRAFFPNQYLEVFIPPPWDLDVEGKTFLIYFIDKCFSGDHTTSPSIGTSFDFIIPSFILSQKKHSKWNAFFCFLIVFPLAVVPRVEMIR